MPSNIGAWEMVVIAILILVIFGGRSLPELGRSLGRSLAGFRRAAQAPVKAPNQNEKVDLAKPTSQNEKVDPTGPG
ncbi:MAG: twin-arginine translocase TatA/TatE family subunit [Candidatus Adiutrix sp.]|jgi:sec-independent protein translocase protein TatA|nr:twin-arginine translocase TatA/TatE family subunit [Candidatus Adiutrix sp.]